MVVILVLRHSLAHDEMVLADRYLSRVAQYEATATLAQKTRLRIGRGQLALPAPPQPLQLLPHSLNLLVAHPHSRFAIRIVVQFLLPALDFLP
jgi:hypothetical protein